MEPPRLILASASPRRRSLLREAGFDFITAPADIDETVFPDPTPRAVALFLAQAKAGAVAARFGADVILGADTVVAHGGQWLGKPADADDARRMLRLLSGTTHEVVTGVCAWRSEPPVRAVLSVTSSVEMRRITPAEIETYIAGGAWRGKAGAYGIQDPDPFVTRTSGSLSNIVGLPIEETAAMLAHFGIKPRGAESAA